MNNRIARLRILSLPPATVIRNGTTVQLLKTNVVATV